MRSMHQYVANRNVFSCFLNLFLPTVGSLRYSGNEFQADGLATKKARLAKELNR